MEIIKSGLHTESRKDDYSQAKSYRPISLMNYLLKGLERLSVWVADTALEDNPLHTKQHGFPKRKKHRNSPIKHSKYD